MLVVSDNDSNIIKAINILAENVAVAKTQDNDYYEAAVCDMHSDRARDRRRPHRGVSE